MGAAVTVANAVMPPPFPPFFPPKYKGRREMNDTNSKGIKCVTWSDLLLNVSFNNFTIFCRGSRQSGT